MIDDATDGLGGGQARVQLGGAKEGEHAGKEVEAVVGMLFLQLSQLLGGSIADEVGASGLEQAMKIVSASSRCPCGITVFAIDEWK